MRVAFAAIQAGLEMYGGLGDASNCGLVDTSHYLGPTINWASPEWFTFSFFPQFGLNGHSFDHLYRVGISYEIDQVFGRFHKADR